MKRGLCGLPLIPFLITFPLISGSPFQYSMFQGNAYSSTETRQRNKWVKDVFSLCRVCMLMKSSLIYPLCVNVVESNPCSQYAPQFTTSGVINRWFSAETGAPTLCTRTWAVPSWEARRVSCSRRLCRVHLSCQTVRNKWCKFPEVQDAG